MYLARIHTNFIITSYVIIYNGRGGYNVSTRLAAANILTFTQTVLAIMDYLTHLPPTGTSRASSAGSESMSGDFRSSDSFNVVSSAVINELTSLLTFRLNKVEENEMRSINFKVYVTRKFL